MVLRRKVGREGGGVATVINCTEPLLDGKQRQAMCKDTSCDIIAVSATTDRQAQTFEVPVPIPTLFKN